MLTQARLFLMNFILTSCEVSIALYLDKPILVGRQNGLIKLPNLLSRRGLSYAICRWIFCVWTWCKITPDRIKSSGSWKSLFSKTSLNGNLWIDTFTYFAARGALLFLVDPRDVPVQVRQLHAERVGRGLSPQPHGHESRAVRDL